MSRWAATTLLRCVRVTPWGSCPPTSAKGDELVRDKTTFEKCVGGREVVWGSTPPSPSKGIIVLCLPHEGKPHPSRLDGERKSSGCFAAILTSKNPLVGHSSEVMTPSPNRTRSWKINCTGCSVPWKGIGRVSNALEFDPPVFLRYGSH